VDVTLLPTLNAILNATSFCLLVAGFRAIKRRAIDTHRRCMLTASTVSALFFVSYVTYHAQAGSKPFEGDGWLRVVYFAILIPHVILAAVLVPLALVTLRRGLARRDAQHRRIARVTFPTWVFVSLTGVAVYLMLYRL
jgi:putative membrane protein